MAETTKNQPGTVRDDLASLAKEYIASLKQLNAIGVSQGRPSKESLRRYRDLWLPLVDKHASVVPPPDVAWLWQCHRLAPMRYKAYMEDTFQGRILEAEPPFEVCDEQAMGRATTDSKELWEDEYPNEPFFLARDAHEDVNSTDLILLCGVDVLASAERQASYLWLVSSPNFSDEDFLDDAVNKYVNFLKSCKSASSTSKIAPTTQIDLIWRTHMVAGVSRYIDETNAILGSPLDHDDSIDNVQGELCLDDSPNFSQEIDSTSFVGQPERTWIEFSEFEPRKGCGFIERKAGARHPYRKNYVFGIVGMNIGYFHIYNRKAHGIIASKLQERISRILLKIKKVKAMPFFMPGKIKKQVRLESELEEIKDLYAIAHARSEAEFPVGKVGIPTSKQGDLEYERIFYDDDGNWIIPNVMYKYVGYGGEKYPGCGGGVIKDEYGIKRDGSSQSAGDSQNIEGQLSSLFSGGSVFGSGGAGAVAF